MCQSFFCSTHRETVDNQKHSTRIKKVFNLKTSQPDARFPAGQPSCSTYYTKKELTFCQSLVAISCCVQSLLSKCFINVYQSR